MEYALIIGLPIFVIALIVAFAINSKRKTYSNDDGIFSMGNSTQISSNENEIIILIEQLPSTAAIDDNKLFEITDHSIVSRISQAIPIVAETATRTVANNALKGMEVYRAIIPGGASLTKSQDMAGAVRGIFHGSKGIRGHANLVKVDLSKTTVVANGVANVMNVGSLIVGQYYMSEINSKIEAMSENVSKICGFQEREFKSRILSLIARAGEISNFSSEILENNELRNRKLQTLDDLKGEGTQLLQQVNLDIDDTIKKNQKPAYKEYQENVDSFGVLIEYQQILMSVLEEISKLTYLLGKGESSSKMCFSVFDAYLEQSNKIRAALDKWHQKQVELLGIDIDKNRRSKTGIGKIVTTIPGFIDDKWNYNELASGLGQKINAQKTTHLLMLSEPQDVYDKDVQIIIKGGKYYYLAGEIHEHR